MLSNNNSIPPIQGQSPTWEELEESMLKGQKLQGVLTAEEVFDVLSANGWLTKFPLFTAIHRIATDEEPVERILEYRKVAEDAVALEVDGDNDLGDEDPFGATV